jgi:hypothetical protein
MMGKYKNLPMIIFSPIKSDLVAELDALREELADPASDTSTDSQPLSTQQRR